MVNGWASIRWGWEQSCEGVPGRRRSLERPWGREGGRQQGRRLPWPLSQGLECLAEELALYLGSQSVTRCPEKPWKTHSLFSLSLQQLSSVGPVSLASLPDFLGREDFPLHPPAPLPDLAQIHNPWPSLVGADESL